MPSKIEKKNDDVVSNTCKISTKEPGFYIIDNDFKEDYGGDGDNSYSSFYSVLVCLYYFLLVF